MATSMRSRNPVMCMAMALPEQRYFILTYSGAKPSMAAPNLVLLTRRTAMMYEALKERSRWWKSG